MKFKDGTVLPSFIKVCNSDDVYLTPMLLILPDTISSIICAFWAGVPLFNISTALSSKWQYTCPLLIKFTPCGALAFLTTISPLVTNEPVYILYFPGTPVVMVEPKFTKL